MRCAVCRCFRGAFLSVSRIWSTNATAAASFHRGRSTFFRRAGNALPIASRTIRRCTFSFLATPAIVPMPNSYSLRICSNSSTFVLQSTEFLRSGLRPFQSIRSVQRVGQNKLPKWAISKYRNHGRIKRSLVAKREFKRAHPCPSTGKGSGACPGYVVDHVQALKHGGADSPSNMQWQSKAEAKAKDRVE